MKTAAVMIIAGVCMNMFGGVTGLLCDKEVAEHNRRRKIRFASGKYVQRQYKKDDVSSFKRRYIYKSTIKSEFCEALVNTVVRLKTTHLRRHITASERDICLIKEEKKYKIRYESTIRDRLLMREVCALKMPGMPELKTINGNISDVKRVRKSQLHKIIAVLARDGMKITDIRIIVPLGQRKAAKEFIESLNLKKRSLICETAKGGTQVLIRIKQP